LRIAPIASDHALILPRRTNPCGYDFRERQEELKQQCEKAEDEITALKATLEKSQQARSEAEARAVELSQRLSETDAQAKQQRDGSKLLPEQLAQGIAAVGSGKVDLLKLAALS
jgi:soluble cytochrome b562